MIAYDTDNGKGGYSFIDLQIPKTEDTSQVSFRIVRSEFPFNSLSDYYYLRLATTELPNSGKTVAEAKFKVKANISPHFAGKPDFVFLTDSMYDFQFFCPSGYDTCIVSYEEDYHPEGQLTAKLPKMYQFPRVNETNPWKDIETPWGPGERGREISYSSYFPTVAKPKSDSLRTGKLIVYAGKPTIPDTWSIKVKYNSAKNVSVLKHNWYKFGQAYILIDALGRPLKLAKSIGEKKDFSNLFITSHF